MLNIMHPKTSGSSGNADEKKRSDVFRPPQKHLTRKSYLHYQDIGVQMIDVKNVTNGISYFTPDVVKKNLTSVVVGAFFFER